ncbi:MAG: helix-turn-helix transcriptional regulator [Alphaproteobacteria bacterium]|nr:helix-turn-helix transcriptional regulator [Alphaproteobacteria bacterium]MBO6863850.1 helix-turn-helix transcriptional regulator [Alphaproteobacteria bacterium]MEC9266729.1 helix-turn-helix transcriptional regulator [Pseudomonadota bacterium]
MQKSIYTEKHKKLVDWLVQSRKAAGLTQQQLADKLGRPQSFVAKYENLERRIDVVEFVEISAQLSVKPEDGISYL